MVVQSNMTGRMQDFTVCSMYHRCRCRCHIMSYPVWYISKWRRSRSGKDGDENSYGRARFFGGNYFHFAVTNGIERNAVVTCCVERSKKCSMNPVESALWGSLPIFKDLSWHWLDCVRMTPRSRAIRAPKNCSSQVVIVMLSRRTYIREPWPFGAQRSGSVMQVQAGHDIKVLQ